MLPKGAGSNLREPLSCKGIYVFEGGAMPVLGLNSIFNELYYKLAIAYPELVFFFCCVCAYSTVHFVGLSFQTLTLYLHGLYSDHVRFNSLQNYPSHDPSLYSHNNRHQKFSFRLATVTASPAAILSIQLLCDLT